jgi:hypothetical protein
VEIIQHPFLFVSALGAVVMDAAGVKTMQVGSQVSPERIRRVSGWGRTVVKLPEGGGHGVGPEEIMICEGEVCRLLREGELDEMTIDGEEVDAGTPKASENHVAAA